MTFGEMIDNLNRFLSRIKTVAILVLLLLFILSVVKNGCSYSETNELVEKITGLNIQNDLLKERIKERNESIQAYRDSLEMIKTDIFIQDQLIADKEKEIAFHKENTKKAIQAARTTPKNEIYEFLDTKAYPDTGKKEFLFSEGQTRQIHITYIESISCTELVSQQDNLITGLGLQIDNKNEEIKQLENTLDLYASNVKSYSRISENQTEIIDTQDVLLKREKKKKNFWKIISGVAIAIGIGASL